MSVDSCVLESAIALRRELHTHPELSNEEVWTKARLIEFLRAHTTNLIIVDRGTWFYAKYVAPGAVTDTQNIAFRADFDALPMEEGIDIPWASKQAGKAHKCGHDGHSSTLMAFAMEVDKKGAPHNICFLWQPAEEVGSGALQCVPMLTEERISCMYGYHNMSGFPYGHICLRNGVMQCASTGMIVCMTGRPTHASQPEMGRNPAAAIAQLVLAIPALTARSEDLLLCTVVQINVGNRQFGMSAYRGELLLTIRAEKEEDLESLKNAIVSLASEAAARDGLDVAFEYSDAFPETRNDTGCTDRVRAVAKECGLSVFEMERPLRPSEDYGHYAKICPACYFFIGNGEDYPPIHTTEYDYPDGILEVGVRMFKGLAGMKS